MRKSRFTKARIIGMIKEQEAEMPTAEVCRKHGLTCEKVCIFTSCFSMVPDNGVNVSGEEDEPRLREETESGAGLRGGDP